MISRDLVMSYENSELETEEKAYYVKSVFCSCPTIASIFDPCYSLKSFYNVMLYVGYLFKNFDPRFNLNETIDMSKIPQRYLDIFGPPASGKTTTQRFIVMLVDDMMRDTPQTHDFKESLLNELNWNYDRFESDMLKLKTGIVTSNVEDNPADVQPFRDLIYTAYTEHDAENILKARGSRDVIFELIPKNELDAFIRICVDVYNFEK